ncbi:hypothetical protein [Gluconobacter morbifer]|uniref:hypothetical protein n=1 Tax=Gluconobacter morbifer TaxID=479935 RepID=UPI0003148AC3|nr:hypothetical protein [Gluconobacter morbifer]
MPRFDLSSSRLPVVGGGIAVALVLVLGVGLLRLGAMGTPPAQTTVHKDLPASLFASGGSAQEAALPSMPPVPQAATAPALPAAPAAKPGSAPVPASAAPASSPSASTPLPTMPAPKAAPMQSMPASAPAR